MYLGIVLFLSFCLWSRLYFPKLPTYMYTSHCLPPHSLFTLYPLIIPYSCIWALYHQLFKDLSMSAYPHAPMLLIFKNIQQITTFPPPIHLLLFTCIVTVSHETCTSPPYLIYSTRHILESIVYWTFCHLCPWNVSSRKARTSSVLFTIMFPRTAASTYSIYGQKVTIDIFKLVK